MGIEIPSNCIGYDPQRTLEYYDDKDYYPFPYIPDVNIQYEELGSGGDSDYCWFQLISISTEESLINMSALLMFNLGIDHYLTDYERTTVCMTCEEDVENAYPDVIVFRYWKYCPRCGNELELGYVKARGDNIGNVRLDDPDDVWNNEWKG